MFRDVEAVCFFDGEARQAAAVYASLGILGGLNGFNTPEK